MLAALLAIPPAVVKAQPGLLHEEESRYQFIQVVQDGEARYLYLNEGYAIHSVWRPDTVLTGGEWDMFLTAPPLLGPAGGAGGDARQRRRHHGARLRRLLPGGAHRRRRARPGRHRRRPPLVRPRTTTRGSPCTRPTRARTWPPRSTRYDLILIDAYRQPYVPFYLATREFFRLCRQRLAPGGIVCLNVSTVPGDHRLAEGIAGTLRTQFPQVLTWQALRFNQFVVGLTAPLSRAQIRARLAAAPRDLLPDTRLFAGDFRRPPRQRSPGPTTAAPSSGSPTA